MWLKQRAINFRTGWQKLSLPAKVAMVGFIVALAVWSFAPDFGIMFLCGVFKGR